LSFQTIWVGPFVGDAILDGAADPSQHLGELLGANRMLWEGKKAHFYADSASSAAKYLEQIDTAGFGSWGVSYNKWVDKLEKLAGELPETQWSMDPVDEKGFQEGYAWLKHLPGEAQKAYTFAAVRRKEADEMLWKYGFVVGDDVTPEGQNRTAKSTLERHQLKGASEHGFSHLLTDLDLHHPPCEKLVANQMFYALGVLAYNLMIAFRVLDLPDDAQGWRPKTIIRNLLIVPVKVSTHARRRVATLCVPAGWMRWWRVFLQDHGPKRTHGGARVRVEESGL
jgi:Transposase DDE domain group 1